MHQMQMNRYPIDKSQMTSHIAPTPQASDAAASMQVRYARGPGARPMAAPKPVMARMDPAPNAAMYASDADRVGRASAGRTPRKWELPATPCRTPMKNEACA